MGPKLEEEGRGLGGDALIEMTGGKWVKLAFFIVPVNFSWKTTYISLTYFLLGIWSWVTSACNGLERCLGSQSKTEAEWCWWEHQILATRPVVRDKGSGPLALQKRIPIRRKVLKQVFIKRKKSTICVDRQADSEGESPSCTLVEVWIIFMRYFFQVSFRQSFWFACFIVHSCCISGSSHVCAHNS